LLFSARRSDASEPNYTPMTGDLKYIRCGVCEELASALHERVEVIRTASQAQRKKLTETQVGEVIDGVCNADLSKGGAAPQHTPDAGNAWMRHLDVVEQDGQLKLVKQKDLGACRRECKTIAASCQDQLDNLDDIDELQVALWKGASKTSVQKKLCKELTSACSKKSKNLKFKGKRVDEKFMNQNQALEQQLARMKAAQKSDADAEAKTAAKKRQEGVGQSTDESLGFVSSIISSASAAGLESVVKLADSLKELGKELSKQLTYKKTEKYLQQLFKDMKRDLYDKVTYKKVEKMAKYVWKNHQPSRIMKDPAFRTVFGIYGILALWILGLETLCYLADLGKSGNTSVSNFLIAASGAFFVMCACGMHFGWKLI